MLEKARSYKHNIQTKVVIMLQFSATKSPFAKRFGLKAFFFWRLLELTFSVVLPHRVSRSDVLNRSECSCVHWLV